MRTARRPGRLVWHMLPGAALIAAALLVPDAHVPVAAQNAPPADGAEGYYTIDQAARGKFHFNRYCAYCHSATPGPMSEDAKQSNRGFVVGSGRSISPLGGNYLRGKRYAGRVMYPSVYYIYNRVESMPANDVDSIGPAIRTDIVAYLLEANGFPPGPRELPTSPERMKAMPLDEPGFSPLFNGRDFTGMEFFLGPNCVPQAEGGCGKADPDPIYSVVDGVLVCNGRAHGYWYTAEKYLNFTLRFDYMYVPPKNWDGDDVIWSGQSGYHLFVTKHDIWPTAIEIQGRNYDVLAPIGVGSRIKYTDDVEARLRARRPLGQWNSVEIVSKGGEVRASLNGEALAIVSEHPFTEPGHIAFESQGTEIRWRNVRIREE
ncbi:MAG: DUF1080 domain-containing protein [Acidimicrobiia bacterium]|nr:DUF1080 domain-containing protein [Acidimicrobiia bacterium]